MKTESCIKDFLGIMITCTNALEATIEWEYTYQKLRKFPHVFRNPSRPIPKPSPCPSSPGARKLISVVIPFDLLRKKEK
jgi:hypothetical protein